VDQHWQIMCGRRKRRRAKDDQSEGGALSELNTGEAPQVRVRARLWVRVRVSSP